MTESGSYRVVMFQTAAGGRGGLQGGGDGGGSGRGGRGGRGGRSPYDPSPDGEVDVGSGVVTLVGVGVGKVVGCVDGALVAPGPVAGTRISGGGPLARPTWIPVGDGGPGR
ncbi:MAG TPA: hypothetical protein VHW74_01870 [Mycobacteriales bacterium]|nr:hypothetical protein [Mycobacteriales bacterium]